jgi:hypothetical protein
MELDGNYQTWETAEELDSSISKHSSLNATHNSLFPGKL